MAVVEQIFPALTWRIRNITMYPKESLDFVKLEDDFDGVHFGIYSAHLLKGVVSLFIHGDVGQFRKLAILPEAQGQALGTQLMEYLIDFCKVQKLTKLWCNASVSAKEFYAKFGFQETDNIYTANGIDYIILELVLS